jgi:hypothetical protein
MEWNCEMKEKSKSLTEKLVAKLGVGQLCRYIYAAVLAVSLIW